MKYAFFFVVLMLASTALFQIGKVGRATLWRTARPYLLIAGVVALAVLSFILIANSGGSFRVL